MSDENRTEATEEQGIPDAPEAAGKDDESPDLIEIDGEKYSPAEIRRWKDTRPNLEKHYQKKFQSLSEKEKELERVRAELEVARSAKAAPDTEDPIDEVVPGLGTRLRQFESKFDTISQALESVKSKAERMDQEAAENSAWEATVDVYDRSINPKSGRPYAKADELRAFMAARGLSPTPENADLAYNALYGFRLGEQTGAARAAKRVNVQTPMGGSEVGAIAGSTPGEVPGVRKPLRETSWEELGARAASDPRRPKVTI